MKKVFIGVFLLLSFFIIFYFIVNYVKNNKKSASPAPSPNISASHITPNAMSAQKNNTNIQVRGPQASTQILPNLPKLPVLPQSINVAKLVPSTPILLQKIQLIKSLLGTVIKIGKKENEILWLAVKDKFSGETIRINVNSEKTRVIRNDIALALKDIKTGDMIRVIFNQVGKENPVNVISIMGEEDLITSTQPK